MECFWCLKGHQANAEVLALFCSPEMNDELLGDMASSLTACLDCVMAYHYARQYFLKTNESAQKELFSWEVNRLCEHLENVLHPKTEISDQSDDNQCVWEQGETFSQDDLLSKLSIPLQEILNYPYLLWSKDLSNHTTAAVLRLEEEGSPFVLNDKFPGVYLLLIHPDCEVRKWAKKSVQFLGSVSCDDYDDLGEIIKWIMSVSEFDLFNFGSIEETMLPLALHLFVEDRKEYWAGVCALLKEFESRTIRLQLLSPDHHNQFVTLLLSAMDSKNYQTDGRDGEFWPLLDCLLILLKRLKSRIWQHIAIKKHSELFLLVVRHPAYRSKVRRLPGYRGIKDEDISDECAASTSHLLDDKNERLSDNEDRHSIMLFVWFKRYLESVVLFGASATDAVKVIFKYFTYLKGELEIQSEGYNCAMTAMIRCLEFLFKNSLRSFLTVVANRWIPDLLEILSFDIDEPPICQKQAILFCKMFLRKNQESGKDVSKLISWLEEKSDGDGKNDPEHLGHLEHLLTLYFKDYPPVARYFSSEQRTIIMPKSSRSRSCFGALSKNSKSSKSPSNLLSVTNTDKKFTVRKSYVTNRSPLLQAKVCLEKLDAERISSYNSSLNTSDEGDEVYLKPVKSIEKTFAAKRKSRIGNFETEKRAQKKQETIIIIDDSSDDDNDDNEPFGLRYSKLKSVNKVETKGTGCLSRVNAEGKLNLPNTNEDIFNDLAQPGRFNGDDIWTFDNVGDTQINMETNAIACNSHVDDEDDHDILDQNTSSRSRKRKIVSKTPAERICISSDDDVLIKLSPLSSRDVPKVKDERQEERRTKKRKKEDAENNFSFEALVSTFEMSKDNYNGEVAFLVEQEVKDEPETVQMDVLSPAESLHGEHKVKREPQTSQMDILSLTESLHGEHKVKREPQTFEVDILSSTESLHSQHKVKREPQTFQMDILSLTESLHGEHKVKREPQTFQMDILSPTESLHSVYKVKSEPQTSQMDVLSATVSLHGDHKVKSEPQTSQMDVLSVPVSLHGEYKVKVEQHTSTGTLEMDALSPTVSLDGDHRMKDEPQTLQMGVLSPTVSLHDEQEVDGEQQVMQTDVVVPTVSLQQETRKTIQMDASLPTVNADDKRAVNDELLGPVQTKKRKTDGGELKKIDNAFCVGTLLSKLETTRNSDTNGVTLPSRKVVQVAPIKPTLNKSVTAPQASKESRVIRKKPVETKPSKPLTLEELFYMILKWDPTMLEKNFSPNIPTGGKVKLTYDSMDDYYNVFKPLLLLECWAQALLACQQSSTNGRIEQTFVVKSAQNSGKRVLLITCHKHITIRSNCEEKFLRENDLIIVKTKDEKLRPVFGVVESVLKERSCWKPGDESVESSNRDIRYLDITISILLIPKDREPLLHETICCVVVTSLVTTLRQWQGMMFFPRSLLARDILQPRIDKCCNNKLSPGKTAVAQVYNQSQSAAINGTLAAVQLPYPIPRISFIQGPPGTGKSHTIIGLIKSYLKNREMNFQAAKDNRLPGSKGIDGQASGKILLCAPSNAAVYVLVRRIITEMKASAEADLANAKGKNCGSINLVCVGRTSVVYPEVLPFALETLARAEVTQRASSNMEAENNAQGKVQAMREKIEDLEKNVYHLRLSGFQDDSEELKCLNSEIDDMVKKKQTLEREYHHIRGKKKMLKHEEEKIRKEVLSSADVICCTLSASGSALLHKFFKTTSAQLPFGCIIVDEACQSSELDLLIPLQFGSSKLVMVGDPEQLRSTVLSKKAQELLLGQSMYERLYKVFKKRAHDSGRALHMTEDNPIQLLDLQYRMHPQISLFPTRYIYQGRVKDESSLATSKSVSSLKPYALLNVRNGVEQISPSGSLCNPRESDFVVEICSMLQQDVGEDHFGIITPYRAQVNLVQKRLRERRLKNVEVDTVDGFQGREKDIILMSCVRANEGQRKGIGFLADRTRLNVALTRARNSLIILLNVNSLKTNNDWRACIDDARQRGVLFDVGSAKDLSQVFQKNGLVEGDRSKSSGSTPSHYLSSGRKSLSPHLSVTYEETRDRLSRNVNVPNVRTTGEDMNVPNKKSSKEDVLPPRVSVAYKKTSTKDRLSGNVNVPNVSSTGEDVNVPNQKSSKEDVLPPRVSVAYKKTSTKDRLCRNVNVPNTNSTGEDMNVPSKNTSKEDVLPPRVDATYKKTSTKDRLSRNVNVPNVSSTGENMNVPNKKTSKEDVLPPRVGATYKKTSTKDRLSRNVTFGTTSTKDILPAFMSLTYKKTSTSDSLSRPVNVPNVNTTVSNKKTSKEDILLPSFEEFDFDDHEPDIRSSLGNDEVFSGGQLNRQSVDCRVNKSLTSGELVDFVVHSGERIQAQKNPYMQQLVNHANVK